MFKRAFFTLSLAVSLGLSSAADSVALRDLAGCKPGSDDPIVTHEGLFKVHMVCDHLLLEIPDRMYNRDMLLNTEFAGLSGSSSFIAPGTLVDNRVVRWLRRGNKVGLVVVDYEIASARTPGIERAVEATSLPSIVKVFNIVGRGATNCTEELGINVAQDLLTANPELKAIYAACGPPAAGAAQAIKNAGIANDAIILVGFDFCCGEKEALEAGIEDATVAQFPAKMAELGVDALVKSIKGEKVESLIDSGAALVTKDNMANF